MSAARECCRTQDYRGFHDDVLHVWNGRHGTEFKSWLDLPPVPLDTLLATRREVASPYERLCARCYVDVRERAMERA